MPCGRVVCLVAVALLGAACTEPDERARESLDAATQQPTEAAAEGASTDTATEDAYAPDADAQEPLPAPDASIITDEFDAAGRDAQYPDDAEFGADGTCSGCEAPRAGFVVSAAAGSAPLSVSATSSAAATEPVVETTYDWGDGDGPTPIAYHRYRAPGSYTVTQRVRDARGQTAAATANLTVAPSDFSPVRFSASDKSGCTSISADGYEVEFTDWGPCGVRSDAAIPPASGVFYFEAHRATAQWRGGGIGLATASARLEELAGASTQSLGVLGYGPIKTGGASCPGSEADSALPDVGFVIDYRTSAAVVHVLQESAGRAAVRATCNFPVSAPLHVFYSGDRSLVGYEIRINTGADTTNLPFRFPADEVRTALTAHGAPDAASALVMGFGKTRAAAIDTLPVLTVPDALSVPFGQSITIEGSAEDREDGALSGHITWVDLASQHHAPVIGKGKTFTFTPSSIGRHPVEASVEDADGRVTRKTVMVKVTGALPSFPAVQLTRDALTGPGITVSSDGLSASFNGSSKDGIRANQGIYNRFWYFEVHRDAPIRNMGMGLVLGDGALNPYEPRNVPWSCSLNVMRGFWINLIEAGDWPKGDEQDYGFAVDYRGEHPRVYIIIRGTLQGTLLLDQVWVPLYPMLYGNPPDAPVSGWDMTLNFGTKPFVYDARAALTAAGVDASALELGWGLTPSISE